MSDVAELLLVGTVHLGSAGGHLHNSEAVDVLTDARQREVVQVVESLGRFRPTKVAIEWPYDAAATMQERWRGYADGTFELGPNEAYQFGFRLAAAAEADLLAIDVEGAWYDPAIEDLIARDTEMAGRWQVMFDLGAAASEATSELMARGTLLEVLRSINTVDSRREELAAYLSHNLWVSEVGNWVGADMVARWFERNMRIAANLDRLIGPGDRVVVIYGAGHAPVLEYLWSWNPRITIVDPLPYLL